MSNNDFIINNTINSIIDKITINDNSKNYITEDITVKKNIKLARKKKTV